MEGFSRGECCAILFVFCFLFLGWENSRSQVSSLAKLSKIALNLKIPKNYLKPVNNSNFFRSSAKVAKLSDCSSAELAEHCTLVIILSSLSNILQLLKA
jgi:hypothetical protein